MDSGKGKAIQAGVRISAAAASGWLSTVLGPEVGSAVAETISEAGVAAVAFLGDRKSERVSRTLIEISDEAATRIAAGEKVRTEIADPESDDASALFEAVIEAAAQSVEDRKCAVIANVYTSVAFDSSITVADIDIAPALSAEFSELGLTLELIGTGIPGGRISNPSTTFGGGQLTTQSVAAMTPTAVGRELIRLGKLEDEVGEDELDALSRAIADTRPGPN